MSSNKDAVTPQSGTPEPGTSPSAGQEAAGQETAGPKAAGQDNAPEISLRQRLDECHDWPCEYIFKFIAPHERAEELACLVRSARVTRRPSRTGKYVSITATVVANSADEVILVYEKASKISGVITL